MRAAILINPRAGAVLADPELPEKLALVLERATGWELLPRDPAATLAGTIDAALAAGAEVLVACGGDGTVRSAAARLAGTECALAVLPLGTLNLFARDIGMPTDPVAAAERLAEATRRTVDVAEVNGEVFLCQSVIGVPNRIGRHREAARSAAKLREGWRIAVAAARSLWQLRPKRVGVLLGSEARPRRFWTNALSVANNDYADAPGAMFRRDRLDGGILAVHLARGFGAGWILRMLLAMALGRWKRAEDIEILRAPALTILSRRRHLRVMNDGEMLLLETPLRYRIRPRALVVLGLDLAP